MDDQPSGSCPTCQRRDARTPQLCDVCRSRLRAWLFDIPALHAELAALEYDGIAGAKAGGRVSGSKEKRLLIDADKVDLTGPVRSAGVAVLDEDAVGYESVASVLDFWVEDWRADRGAGERRPSPTVPELARWLLDRLDDACDTSPAIGEFFDAVRRLRGALKAQLGQVDIPDYKRGVPCPRCQALTLVQHDGSDRVECASCPALLSFIEYDTHVRALSAVQVQLRRSKVAKVKAVRRLLEAMRAAGWHRAVGFEDTEGEPLAHRADPARANTVLVWSRGNERVEARVEVGRRAPDGWVYYTADVRSLASSIVWFGDDTIAHVQKLARAAGILTAPKKEEVAA